MLPVIEIFGKELSMYMLCALVGGLVAGISFCMYIGKCGYDDNKAILFIFTLIGGVVVGGSLLYAITNADKFYLLGEAEDFVGFWKVVLHLFGGSVFYGGLIGAIIAGSIFIKCAKLPRETYMDGCAFMAPLFHAFARVGCFFAGCCYGVESDFGFAAHGNQVTDIGEVSRFPVQLLETLENLLIFGFIVLLLKKRIQKGRLFYIYLLCYSVFRFINEFFRGDKIRGFIFGISTSQFISILIFIAAVSLLVYENVKKKENTADDTINKSIKDEER